MVFKKLASPPYRNRRNRVPSSGTHTDACVRTQADLCLRCRPEDGPSNILEALDDQGRPRILKLLTPPSPGKLRSEVLACQQICPRLDAEDYTGCVPVKIITMVLTEAHNGTGRAAGTYPSLLMHAYVKTVACLLQLSEAQLALRLEQLIKAVEHMHALGWVHMDLKVSPLRTLCAVLVMRCSNCDACNFFWLATRL